MELIALAGNPSRRRKLQIETCLSGYALVLQPSPDMQSLFRQMGRRKSLFDSMVQTAIQQHVVDHAEHNKAQKKLWSSTAPGSDSRRLDLCLASGHSQLRKRE